MTKATINVNPDGAPSVRGYAAEFPINGDVLVLSGWKAKAKLMDRATDAFINSEELAEQAAQYFGIPKGDPKYGPWELAQKVHAEYPGGLPRFVTLPIDQNRRVA